MSEQILNYPAGTLVDESKMDKLRGRFSTEFLNDLTERIVTGLGGGVEDRFRAEIAKVRAANHDPISMEILMARKNMLLDDAIQHIGKMVEVSEADDEWAWARPLKRSVSISEPSKRWRRTIR